MGCPWRGRGGFAAHYPYILRSSGANAHSAPSHSPEAPPPPLTHVFSSSYLGGITHAHKEPFQPSARHSCRVSCDPKAEGWNRPRRHPFGSLGQSLTWILSSWDEFGWRLVVEGWEARAASCSEGYPIPQGCTSLTGAVQTPPPQLAGELKFSRRGEKDKIHWLMSGEEFLRVLYVQAVPWGNLSFLPGAWIFQALE